MSASDLDAVVQIENRSFPTPWTAGMLASELNLERSSVFVLVEDDKLVGYVFSRLLAEELHIVNLAIHPDQRCKGYGTFLLKYICEFGRDNGCRLCFLEVRTTNLSAIRLYQKAGFSIIRKRSRYYADGSDAYVMGVLIEKAIGILGA